jgi:hypothetical protein
VVVEFIKEIKDTHRKKFSEQVLDDVKPVILDDL